MIPSRLNEIISLYDKELIAIKNIENYCPLTITCLSKVNGQYGYPIIALPRFRQFEICCK